MMDPIFKIDNSHFYRFLLPLFPGSAIGILIMVIAFDFNIWSTFLLGFILGIVLSEIFYYWFKDEWIFFEDRIERRIRNQVKESITISKIKEVIYSKEYDRASMQFARHLRLDTRNDAEFVIISIEPTRSKWKMQKVLEYLKNSGIKLNDEAEKVLFANGQN